MAIYIRDEATDAAIRELARIKGKGLTDTIREAVKNETSREREKVPFMERIRALQDEVAKYPKSGLKADKAFFDELSGDL